MKVKIFNGFGEYSRDMDFDEFAKSGFEFASNYEMNIFYRMKSIIRNSKGKNRKDIESVKQHLRGWKDPFCAGVLHICAEDCSCSIRLAS